MGRGGGGGGKQKHWPKYKVGFIVKLKENKKYSESLLNQSDKIIKTEENSVILKETTKPDAVVQKTKFHFYIQWGVSKYVIVVWIPSTIRKRNEKMYISFVKGWTLDLNLSQDGREEHPVIFW
jgi:hypothetical protein